MNKLSAEKKTRVVAALVEGNSIRATVRMTGVSKKAVSRLLVELGEACARYQNEVFVDLKCKRIQCDEIWTFTYAKEKNCTDEMKAKGYGNTWTWVAMCADTKLVPCWLVGDRSVSTAYEFMSNLKGRIAGRFQLTTDSYRAYLNAVDEVFGTEIDYAMLHKIYGTVNESPETRYSPAVCMGARKATISGNPDHKHVSTSYAERQNLTMRMSMRRFTRLTNGFSRKLHNHHCALAIHYMYYNFARIHQSLHVTPAMEAGVADHVWEIEEVISLLI